MEAHTGLARYTQDTFPVITSQPQENTFGIILREGGKEEGKATVPPPPLPPTG